MRRYPGSSKRWYREILEMLDTFCRRIWNPRFLQAGLCAAAGVILYFAAETVDSSGTFVENGKLSRNPCGKGDAVYEFFVDGLCDEEDTAVLISVPEQKMTAEEFSLRVPEVVEVLCRRILGENPSLDEVRLDLDLVREVPEFGVTVTWESEHPEVVSALGGVEAPEVHSEGVGTVVYLRATLTHGAVKEVVEIPVTVYPPLETMEMRFLAMMEELVVLEPESVDVILPEEFEGRKLSYRSSGDSQNLVLILLGLVAGGCMIYKEKSDLEAKRKRREKRLMEDYPDLVSEFLILIGAGYPAKGAWKKLTAEYSKEQNEGLHPLYEEMQVAVNQMESGVPETRVYAEFGRRCQLRSYVKFASLLETTVNTGGKQLRKLLENEVEEAFKQRTDLAKRNGEELSSKLLLPMFGMLGVVMVMVAAPAFLSFM